MKTILTAAEDKILIENGFEPIPVAGKAAVTQGWQSGPIDGERIAAMREVNPEARSTGLRTGKLATVDIDVVADEAVNEIVHLADAMLGKTPLARFGSKGLMLCYHNPDPIRKMTVTTQAETPGEFADKIEILGTGLQFVAFGIHPGTGQPFHWLRKDDFDETATPLNTPLEALPQVSPEQLDAFCDAAARFLSDRGYKGVSRHRADEHKKEEREDETQQNTQANIDRAQAHLRNCVERGRVAVVGSLGSDTIYQITCELIDRFYLSEDKAAELMHDVWYPHCVPNTLWDDAREIISHAASYIQNEPGARALPPVAETFKDALSAIDVEPQVEVVDTGAAKQLVLQDENFDTEDGPRSAADYAAMEFPKLRELIPIWCERNVNTFLEGPAATQKSRAALQDAIALSNGMPVMGQEVKEPVACLYLNYENSPDEMARRVHSICQVLQPSNKDATVDPSGVKIWELRKNPRPIIVVKRDAVLITRFGQRVLSWIATQRNLGKHTLVVFDGLMDAIIFQENTRNDDTVAMSLIRTLDSWCEEYDFSAYSIVHPSRSSERGGTVGSYATAWTTKPRAIQTFRRVLSPFVNAGPKAKITEDTPLQDIFFQRRVQKRSNGPEGERMLLEFWKGGLRPHHPKKPIRPASVDAQPAPANQPESDLDEEVPF